jgi:hypothetical protein
MRLAPGNLLTEGEAKPDTDPVTNTNTNTVAHS